LPGNRPTNPINNRPGTGPGQRPNWSNIDKDKMNNINNKWGNTINNKQNWGNNIGSGNTINNNYYNNWGNNGHHNWNGGDFDIDIDDVNIGYGGWHYGYGGGHYHDDDNWWVAPAFTAVAGFLGAAVGSAVTQPSTTVVNPAPTTTVVYPQPIVYDYAPGGNVMYEDNSVYIAGDKIASTEEFAESAAALATVEPPKDEEAVASTEWLPLGRFAVVTDAEDKDPARAIELAVDKQGIIAGTLTNSDTGKAEIVQGKVDKATQRVAFKVGDNQDVVCETGLGNLTLEEAPVLVHFGKDKVENYLLVRLPAPEVVEGGAKTEADSSAK